MGTETGLMACADGDWALARQEAVSGRADLSAADADGLTMLHWAAMSGRLELCRELLGLGADSAALDEEGLTPGILACAKGEWDCAMLFANKKSSKIADPDGWTMLHYAAAGSQTKLVEALLASGADPAQADAESLTAGLLACAQGRWEQARILAATGAGLDAQDEDGWSMLHYAADNAQPELLGILLKGGASVSLRDAEGLTAADFALDDPGCRWALPELIKNGAKVDAGKLSAAGLDPLGHGGEAPSGQAPARVSKSLRR